MARLVLYGVPLGFSVCECSKEDYDFVKLNYIGGRNGNRLHVERRPNGEVFYSYLMYPPQGTNFCDAGGRRGAFFGMSLILKDQIITDINKVATLFKKTYQEYVKDQIIQEYPNGGKKFLVSSLRSDDDRIAKRVARGMENIMKNNPELDIFNDIKECASIAPAQLQQHLNKAYLVR